MTLSLAGSGGQAIVGASSSQALNTSPVDASFTPQDWADDDIIMVLVRSTGHAPSASGWTRNGAEFIGNVLTGNTRLYYRQLDAVTDAAYIGTQTDFPLTLNLNAQDVVFTSWAVRGATSVLSIYSPDDGSMSDPAHTDRDDICERNIPSTGTYAMHLTDSTSDSTTNGRLELHHYEYDPDRGNLTGLDTTDFDAVYPTNWGGFNTTTGAFAYVQVAGAYELKEPGDAIASYAPEFVDAGTPGAGSYAVGMRWTLELDAGAASPANVNPDAQSQYDKAVFNAKAMPFYVDSVAIRGLDG